MKTLLSSLLFAGFALAETVTIQPGAKIHVYSGSGPTEPSIKALRDKKVPVQLVPAADADYLFLANYGGITWEPTYTVRTYKNCRTCGTQVSVDEHKGKTGGEIFHGCAVIDLHTRKVVWEAQPAPRDRAHTNLFPKTEKKCAEWFGQAIGKPLDDGTFVYPVDSPLSPQHNWIKAFAK